MAQRLPPAGVPVVYGDSFRNYQVLGPVKTPEPYCPRPASDLLQIRPKFFYVEEPGPSHPSRRVFKPQNKPLTQPGLYCSDYRRLQPEPPDTLESHTDTYQTTNSIYECPRIKAAYIPPGYRQKPCPENNYLTQPVGVEPPFIAQRVKDTVTKVVPGPPGHPKPKVNYGNRMVLFFEEAKKGATFG